MWDCKHKNTTFIGEYPKYKYIIDGKAYKEIPIEGETVEVRSCDTCEETIEITHVKSQKPNHTKPTYIKEKIKNVVKEWNDNTGAIIQKTVGGEYYKNGHKVYDLKALKAHMEKYNAVEYNGMIENFDKRFHEMQKDAYKL